MTKTRKSKHGGPGLREIAAEANVSIATVSRVLNGNARVDPAMRKQVLDAADRLNIDTPQPSKSGALVFLLSNRTMLPPFHACILAGAESYCAAHGWDLFFVSLSYPPNATSRELHLPKLLQRREMVRGVILAGNPSPNLIELLEQKNISYVVLGSNILGEFPTLKNDVVFSDEMRGGEDVTRYLISLGHRDIWFVGNTRLPWFARYHEGYCRVMEEASLTPRLSSIDSEDDTEIGYLGTKYLLSTGEPVSAIFAGNDSSACGVYKGLREQGLRIPENISVVGCNDTVGDLLYPSLTTIREFPEQMGRHMAELLLERIANPELESRRLMMPTQFIRRDSCAPVAGGETHSADDSDSAFSAISQQ
ncbi:LacI family DNA-binding transcriptional regulator [Sodalis ligni]|jgi:LacI family transcriptional regulator|uniref:LacI family transcriptional regulator n=1 Tax=Sodalis ligni TaxID=2697027 RepID=A0A4R1NGV0_9GAMM|nr:LacI family DNA-binding transcriptional regulator [Sodalis ligni]TCL06733.1 LacI family transcriptional regulator [Sodalis ligni]